VGEDESVEEKEERARVEVNFTLKVFEGDTVLEVVFMGLDEGTLAEKMSDRLDEGERDEDVVGVSEKDGERVALDSVAVTERVEEAVREGEAVEVGEEVITDEGVTELEGLERATDIVGEKNMLTVTEGEGEEVEVLQSVDVGEILGV